MLIDSINSIYDANPYCYNCQDSCTICEQGTIAKLRKVVFNRNSTCFYNIKNDLYKGFGSLLNRSSFLKDSDCDGICLYYETNIIHFIFVDLKSQFSESDINKAFEQDLYSLLKVYMLLSLCCDYKKETLRISFYAACPRCDSTDDEDTIKYNILLSDESGEDRFANRYLKSYFFGANCCCKLKDIPSIKNKIFNDSLLDLDVEFNIATPNSTGCSECNIDL